MKKPIYKRLLSKKWVTIPLILIVILVMFLSTFNVTCSQRHTNITQINDTTKNREIFNNMKDYTYPEDSTYLRYPEWYTVYSYIEYADYIKDKNPSTFPYFSSIGQYWNGYCHAYGLTHGRYTFNFGDHLMLGVVGVSFTAEYALKGIYEMSIGRMTEAFVKPGTTEEDIFSYNVAKDYSEFINVRPWYEYPFGTKLKELWTETSLIGWNPVRKWERKAALTLEYGVKAFYGLLIGGGSQGVYGTVDVNDYVWIKNASEELFTELPRVQKVKQLGEGEYIAIIPRYQEFTTVSEQLADRHIQYIDIAGNDEIMFTAIASKDWNYDEKNGELLFTTRILTNPEKKRVAIRTSVINLNKVLKSLREDSVKIEHIYDY